MLAATVATVAVPVGLAVVKTETVESRSENLMARVPAAVSSYDPSGLDLKSSEELFDYATPTPPPAPSAPSTWTGHDPIEGEDFPADGRYQKFIDGLHDGGWLDDDAHIRRMVWCESGWQIETTGQFLGLAQFHVGTWPLAARATGFDDWRNPYHQGFNTAYWINGIAAPGSTAGWPHCWWA